MVSTFLGIEDVTENAYDEPQKANRVQSEKSKEATSMLRKRKATQQKTRGAIKKPRSTEGNARKKQKQQGAERHMEKEDKRKAVEVVEAVEPGVGGQGGMRRSTLRKHAKARRARPLRLTSWKIVRARAEVTTS